MSFKRILSFVVTVSLLLLPIVAILQRQNLYDWWVLRSYVPPAEIAQLAADTTMTEQGKRIFYVTKPEIKSVQDFRGECTSAEQTIVLGCYKTGSGIFLYEVTDPRLAGIKQVTAAHEMLHAAYDRLSSKEKETINSLTEQAYANVVDERLRKNVEAYRTRDESVVPNELHSILGSEVEVLPAQLEEHYKKYFNDRQKIVQYSKQYEKEFSERQAKVEAYDMQLKRLKSEIDTLKSDLDNLEADINSQKSIMDALYAEKKYEEYNKLVSPYNAKIAGFNVKANVLRQKIAEHNTIVEQRNALVVEEQELYKAIDTRVPSAR